MRESAKILFLTIVVCYLTDMKISDLNARLALILKYVVEQYILDGQPVGSKALAERSGLLLSSATVRNSMSELESLGFIVAPHRSAGRIPTVLGFRYFVDYLLTSTEPQAEVLLHAQQSLEPAHTTQELLKTASEVLSHLTHWVGVVTIPKVEKTILRHIEFLPLSAHRTLAVLVVNDRDVQNRIIMTDRAYSAVELQQIANFLNQHFVGQDLLIARQGLLNALHEDKMQIDYLIKTAIEVGTKAFEPTVVDEEACWLTGEHQLLTRVQADNVDDLQKWVSAFSQKKQILTLFNDCILSDGIQIFIGEESGHEALAQCSLITAHYYVNSEPVGVLGVIGPTRMQYNQVISVVDMTAKLLSSALRADQNKEEK